MFVPDVVSSINSNHHPIPLSQFYPLPKPPSPIPCPFTKFQSDSPTMSGRLRRRRETVLGFGIYPIMMPASYLQAAFHEKNRVQDTRVVFQEGKELLPRTAISGSA